MAVKVCFQMYRPATGERSEPFLAEADQLVDHMSKLVVDSPDSASDFVIVVWQQEDSDPRPVISRFPVLTMANFVRLFRSDENVGEILPTAVSDECSAALQSGPESGD